MAKSQRKSQRAKKQQPAETPTISLKEQLAQKRKANQARQEFINLLTKNSLIACAIGLLLFFVGGIKAAAPGMLGVLILSLSNKYPREAMFAFIIYVPVGGTITYYLGNSPILQLAKDAFYVPAVIGLWQNCRRQGLPFIIPPGIKTPLMIILGCCLLTLIFINGGQQLNPGTSGLRPSEVKEIPIGMGILGLKVFLGYVPLISCAYYLIRNRKDFLLLSRLQVVLTILCCGLGFIQYILLYTGICHGTRGLEGNALFVTSLDARCYFGGALLYSPEEGVIRLPGTFVAPWQWAWFLISSTFLNFASAFSDPSIIWRLISLISLASIFMNTAICGQRIALVLVPICFILLLIITGQIGNLKRFIPIGVGLAVIMGIAIISNPELVQERLESLTSRWEASPPQEFIVNQFEETWKNVAGPIGSGLGRATNSARALGSTNLIENLLSQSII